MPHTGLAFWVFRRCTCSQAQRCMLVNIHRLPLCFRLHSPLSELSYCHHTSLPQTHTKHHSLTPHLNLQMMRLSEFVALLTPLLPPQVARNMCLLQTTQHLVEPLALSQPLETNAHR